MEIGNSQRLFWWLSGYRQSSLYRMPTFDKGLSALRQPPLSKLSATQNPAVAGKTAEPRIARPSLHVPTINYKEKPLKGTGTCGASPGNQSCAAHCCPGTGLGVFVVSSHYKISSLSISVRKDAKVSVTSSTRGVIRSG